MKTKKQAKTAHGKSKQSHEQVGSKLIMVAGTHKISKNWTGRTDCDQRVNEGDVPGWRYGHAEDVTCETCGGTT